MKTKYKRLMILFLILAATVIFALAYCCRNHIYIAAVQIFASDIRLEEVSVKTEKIKISDLETDSRFEVDQSLMLINTEYRVPQNTVFDIIEYKNTGVEMNSCMAKAYGSLSAAVFAETGEKLYVSSHTRTAEEQSELFEESPELAAEPGASEHETGLCLDIYVQYNAGDNFIKTDAGRFVNTKCHEYGFIIRYPMYGGSETGIRFEPWHIRYVGDIHARIVYANSLTLEEYIFSLEENVVYSVENFLITRQQPIDGFIEIPVGFEKYHVAPDNTGFYIVTVYCK